MPNPILQRARTGLLLAGTAAVSPLFALTSIVMLLMYGAFGSYCPGAGLSRRSPIWSRHWVTWW